MNYLIIPCRMDSTRFAGKPLALIDKVPMVIRTYDRCKAASGFDEILILTNSDEILFECQRWSRNCVLQDVTARNGTERIAMYARERITPGDLVVNIQADEPLMDPAIPQRLLLNLKIFDQFVWTAVRRPTPDELLSQDTVKCLVEKGTIVDYSRLYVPGYDWAHIGAYAYSYDNLMGYLKAEEHFSEREAKLEQLRWSDPLHAISVDYHGIGVDRPQDIARVEARLTA